MGECENLGFVHFDGEFFTVLLLEIEGRWQGLDFCFVFWGILGD